MSFFKNVKDSEEALLKRHRQGWVLEVEKNLKSLIARIKVCKREKIAASIAYHGNIVDLWEALVQGRDKLAYIWPKNE